MIACLRSHCMPGLDPNYNYNESVGVPTGPTPRSASGDTSSDENVAVEITSGDPPQDSDVEAEVLSELESDTEEAASHPDPDLESNDEEAASHPDPTSESDDESDDETEVPHPESDDETEVPHPESESDPEPDAESVAPQETAGTEAPPVVGRAIQRQAVVNQKRAAREAAIAKAARIAQAAADEAAILKKLGGEYTLLSRSDYRVQYGAVAPVGNARTCIPDACWTVVLKLRPSLNGQIALKWVRKAFYLPNNEDPNMHMVKMFFLWFGIDFQYVQSMRRSPRNLFRSDQGIFLVRLEIGLPVEGDFFDQHVMVYDANLKHLYDNQKSMDIPCIEKKDLGNNRKATRPFQHYFKFATSLIVSDVYQVSLKTTITSSLTHQGPPTRKRPRKEKKLSQPALQRTLRPRLTPPR